MNKVCSKCCLEFPETKEYFRFRKDTKKFRSECKKCAYINNDKYNKDYLKERNEYIKERMKKDIIFKMRMNVSSIIKTSFKKQGLKKNSSTWKALPYTPQQLRDHLENLFEPWMTWENHGIYDPNRKTWHIDHITPQSLLPYDSLDHPNFLKCWSLENLKPLEAYANMLKGN